MKRIFFQIIVIFAVLLAFGAAKLNFEDKLHHDMVEQRLLQPPLKEGASLKLGQTGSAVALGGLRSLVAAIWSMKAFVHFENLNWIKLEESYETITDLQPQTSHYWETGAWHLHTNASVYYLENKKLSHFERQSLRKRYIEKGSAFLEEGVRHNPDNYKLRLELARIWTDRHKLPDPPRALKHYEDALATQSLPNYHRNKYQRFRLYTMARIPEKQHEALTLATSLYNQTPTNHLPNLVCILYALQNAANLPPETRIPDSKLFPNPATQQKWLQNYYSKNRNLGYPTDGIPEKLRSLKQQ